MGDNNHQSACQRIRPLRHPQHYFLFSPSYSRQAGVQVQFSLSGICQGLCCKCEGPDTRRARQTDGAQACISAISGILFSLGRAMSTSLPELMGCTQGGFSLVSFGNNAGQGRGEPPNSQCQTYKGERVACPSAKRKKTREIPKSKSVSIRSRYGYSSSRSNTFPSRPRLQQSIQGARGNEKSPSGE